MSQILTYPHLSLRRQSQTIKKKSVPINKTLAKLKRTLTQKNNGVGLAAPQIDILQRVFATYLPSQTEQTPKLRYFINPVIITHSSDLFLSSDIKKQPEELEGCLSVPQIYAPVYRYQWLELQYQTWENFELITRQEKFTGFEARVIQHELDHLDGILFIDHVLKQKTPIYLQKNQQLHKISLDDLQTIFGPI